MRVWAKQDLGPHLAVLVACLSILLIAAVLQPAGSELELGGKTLPGLCVLRQTTGLPCPGCGLTRSIVAAVHGRWVASFAFHRLGPIWLAYLLLQAAYRLVWIGLPGLRRRLRPAGRIIDMALLPLMALLIINWVPTLVQAFARL